MADLGLNSGGLVESDGGFLVSKEDYCSQPHLMKHENKYLQEAEKTRYIMRYLMARPLGYALLLGSSSYNASEEPLKCVQRDLWVMREVLRESGWEVDSPLDCSTTRESYENRLGQLKQMNLEKYSCFLFYYSGHGSHKGMLFPPNRAVVTYKEVIDDVFALEHLQGKPKILVFDCCRTDHQSGEEPLGSLRQHFASTYHDMIVCFACAANAASMALGPAGSIFTQNFAKKLQEFGREMTFEDLLTQAKGETYHMALSRFGVAQRPVSNSGLIYQLLLKETSLNGKDRERAKHKKTRVVLVPLRSQMGQFVEKHAPPTGPNSNSIHATPISETATPTSTSPEPVMRDHVTTKTKFTSKHDVISNTFSLGRGHHVFLCYLPDPASPYGSPDASRVRRNLDRISLLQYDLTQHGFAVTSDLSLADQEPISLLQWYVWQIERCNHVVLVCSPALKELFSATRPRQPVVDEKASRFLVYSSAIYSESERCARNGVGKFIPVVLEPEWLDLDKSVPLLFRGGHIYKLLETAPRQFNYDNMERCFERMVCRMVGINRTKLDAPQPRPPITFTSTSSSVETVNRSKYLAQAALPRPGYVTVPSKVGLSVSQRSSREQAWGKVTLEEPSNHHDPPPSYQASQASGGGGVNVTVGRGVRQYGYETTATPSVTAALPSTEDKAPPHSLRHYVAPNYGATPSPVPPPHPTPSTTSATIADPDPASLLPPTPPSTELLLWLSEHVVQWKFLGRYLDVEENVIERISLENPLDIREQCYKMLQAFSMRGGSESTCQRLGRALSESEKNKHLFEQFCRKVEEIFSHQ